MKTTSALTKILLGLIMVLLMCLFLDFLALHDIRNDYVSATVINRFMPATTSVLPEWTETPGEWSLIRFSFVVKLFVSGLTIPIVWALRKNYRLTK